MPETLEERLSSSAIEAHLNNAATTNSITQCLSNLYVWMEDIFQPDRTIKTRDFYYAVFDPRHWGRKLSNGCGDLVVSKKQTSQPCQISKADSYANKRTAPKQIGKLVTGTSDSGDGWLTVHGKHQT